MLEHLDLDSEILTITQLNRCARELVETQLPLIWAQGEISNFAKPRSGHWYFSLKDEYAQVRCAMFRPKIQGLNFEPSDGLQVMVRARVSIYEPRGDFQLIVEHIEETGFGALQRAFEQLKAKLNKEGLFALEHKRPIPTLPQQIGVITSATGAAIRDVLIVLKRRFPAIPVIIYPSQVQGKRAAADIVSAINKANTRQECDVLLLVRGGGSLEDLWPFNEEIVARAMFASNIPIISGVGHEVDTTIADFIADQRAATPSAAAELVSPNRQDWLLNIKRLYQRLAGQIRYQLQHANQEIQHLSKRLQHPGRTLEQQAQQLDQLEKTLLRLIKHTLARQAHGLSLVSQSLVQHSPGNMIKQAQQQTNNLAERLIYANKQQVNQKLQQLQTIANQLDSLSPLQTLHRGYAILTRDKKLLRYTHQTKIGDKIQAQLIDGVLECVIEGKDEQKIIPGTIATSRIDTSDSGT